MRLENANIDAVNVPWLRNKLGLVSQEPVLFNRTIADNIRYGDLAGTATMDQVMEAARRANLHTWVASLPAGYDTLVGSGGRQLSVGQRQRLAIAQTLVRWDTGHRGENIINLTTVPRAPRIMLLDEATSTLDFENEKAVQVGRGGDLVPGLSWLCAGEPGGQPLHPGDGLQRRHLRPVVRPHLRARGRRRARVRRPPGAVGRARRVLGHVARSQHRALAALTSRASHRDRKCVVSRVMCVLVCIVTIC